jgi:hypothetical protein
MSFFAGICQYARSVIARAAKRTEAISWHKIHLKESTFATGLLHCARNDSGPARNFLYFVKPFDWHGYQEDRI